MAYVLGAALLDLNVSPAIRRVDLAFYLIFGIGFLAFHIWLYFEFLKER